MRVDDELQLVDLLARQELGMRLLTDADPQVPIHGAHAIEVQNPARWLKPAWLMLTTGARFSEQPADERPQRALISELTEAGISALGFGVGVSMNHVPPALLEEANRHGFPVVSIPLEVPFLQVIDSVNEATLAKDFRQLQRTVGIQDYLLEALAEDHADAALVRRLSELLRSTVVLYDQAGSIVASSGVGPTQIIRSELRARPAQRNRFTIGRWHVVTEPVSAGEMVHWLAVASRRRAVSDDLAEPAMQAARRLVSMIARSREAIQVENRLRRAELLRLLIAGNPSDEQYIWDRLEMQRFRREEALRLLVLTDTRWHDSDDARLDEPSKLQRAIPAERAAVDCDLRLLLAGHGEHLLCVVEAAWPAIEAWSQRLAPTTRCGISEPFSDLSRAPVRLREAELALDSALRDEHKMLRFEELGLLDWLVAGREATAVREKAAHTLRALDDNEALLEALAEFMRNQCDMQRTARSLGLHPNSVRYRLKRVEQLLGRDLRSPADIGELYLALRASDLHRDSG